MACSLLWGAVSCNTAVVVNGLGDSVSFGDEGLDGDSVKGDATEGDPHHLHRVVPVESDELLSNPGIGWMTFRQAAATNTHIPAGVTSTIHYRRIAWNAIHVGDDAYDWSPIETQIEQARESGQQYLFRVMPTNPSSNPPTSGPEWMRDAGYAGFTHKHKGRGDELWVPDLDDPQVQVQVTKLLEQLGNRYDNHPDILAFEISFFGTWGEGHFGQAYLPPYDDPSAKVPIPTDATLQWLADEHYRSFLSTALIGPIGCNQGQTLTKYMYETHGSTIGAGIFMDCWGDYPTGPDDWAHMTDNYPRCLELIHGESEPQDQIAWQRGVIRLETCGVMSGWGEGDIQEALDWALDKHASFFHNKMSDVPEDSVGDVIETLKRLGYRLVLRSMEHPEVVHVGQPATIKIDFDNIGVAPPYQDFFLAVRLDNPDDEQTYVSSESIKHWLPGEHSRTLVVPLSVAPGEYVLSVAIVSRYDDEPAINLAIEGRAGDGWYPLSSLRVAP
ncbi:DUF4832 domain-containing protein [Myxococcota bacterium]